MKTINFIHIPKTGGSALTNYFSKHYPRIQTLSHHPFPKNQIFNTPNGSNSGISGKINKGDYTFTILRNPYDYWVSNFFYSIKHSPPGHGFWYGKYGRMDHKEHFKLFVTDVHKRHNDKVLETDSMTAYYNCFCYDENKKFTPQYVGKLENLNSDLAKILKKCNQPIVVEPGDFFSNSSNKINQTKHKHYSFYYDDEVKSMIKGLEKKIIDKYNYSFETN